MDGRPILLVEDDANDVLLCQHAFKEARVPNPLLIVRDGAEAIDYLEAVGKFADRARFPLPIAIVLDLKMPRVSGFEFLQWLREQPDHERFVVIICSSSNIPGDVERAYALGAHGFVLKPYTIAERTELWICFKNWWLRFNQFPYSGLSPRKPELRHI
jgi:CheY-like chemotaxis protein